MATLYFLGLKTVYILLPFFFFSFFFLFCLHVHKSDVQNEQKRRKIAAWSITLLCIGVLVLTSAASAENFWRYVNRSVSVLTPQAVTWNLISIQNIHFPIIPVCSQMLIFKWCVLFYLLFKFNVQQLYVVAWCFLFYKWFGFYAS